MVFNALTAFLDRARASKILVTAVLPGGCNYDCPFCIVKQRDERSARSYISSRHLNHLQAAFLKRGILGGAAIVGDEPLQSHCWPDAKNVLHFAQDNQVPSALISNGHNLVDFISELRQLPSTKLLISLDAASEKHDVIRRKPGAFARIAEGIRVVAQYPDLLERIAIGTILTPGNLEDISGIISFTAANGIKQLLLSPLLTSGRTEPLAVHPKIMRDGWRGIPDLLAQAKAQGVRLRLSDEFAVLGPWESKLAETGIEFVAPKEPAHLIRVDAAGRVETLSHMLAGKTTGLQLPEDVAEMDRFVDKLIANCFASMRAAA